MLSSGIGIHQAQPYGISSVEEDKFLCNLVKSPLASVMFITVRDPNQASGDWCNMSKVSNWMRRYSDNYYVVRGTASGSHFHMLSIIKKDARKLRPQKGVHFHIISMNKNTIEFDSESNTERRECKEKAVHYQQQTFDMLTLDLYPSSQAIIISIKNMIKQYWRKKAAKSKRLVKRNTKTSNY